jgi:GntR family transcriptional regulator/MocR family aminotransferase
MPRSRTSSSTELLVELRREDAAPLHRQIERELRAAIRSGRIGPDALLPSTRGLADQLGLSRGVVVEAYEQLVAEGYLVSRPGGATRVCSTVADVPHAPESAPRRSEVRIDFGYGRPDVTQFPRHVWLRSIRRVLNEAPSDRLGYLDNRGAPELREALAAYLNRVRGTAASPDRIVITTGFAQALTLVTLVLKAAGAGRIANEDPGQGDTVRAAERAGLAMDAVAVDGQGVVAEALVRSDPDAVVLTPAHQFPTGAVLSPERRARVLAWARSRRRWILEDDYDAEYRYDREPIGALQGLAPDRVIYAGSASKTLAPGLRLGWLILPAELVEPVAETKVAVDRGSASLEQLAFADFLAHGEFDHHLRRMRPVYRARRDALLGSLRRHLPDLSPAGASAGLHVVAWLPPGIDDARVVAKALELGVALEDVGRYRASPSGQPGGLLFGYGMVSESEIEAGVRIVARAMEASRGDGYDAGAQVDEVGQPVAAG